MSKTEQEIDRNAEHQALPSTVSFSNKYTSLKF